MKRPTKKILFLFLFLSLAGLVYGQSNSNFFRGQRSVNLETLLSPWLDIQQSGRLLSVQVSPKNDIYLLFNRSYLVLARDFSLSPDTLLSIFYSSQNTWQSNNAHFIISGLNRIVRMDELGNISLYNSLLGAWLPNVNKLDLSSSYSINGRQLLQIKDGDALYRKDILDANEKDILILEGMNNVTQLELLPRQRILYFDSEESALFLADPRNLPPLYIVPPRAYYKKSPQFIGSLSEDNYYAIYGNTLVCFDISGNVLYSTPLPDNSSSAYTIGSELMLYLAELQRLEVYSPQSLNSNYPPPPAELLIKQAISTGRKLEYYLLFDQALDFYQWVETKIDEILKQQNNNELYSLRLEINRAQDRVRASQGESQSQFYFGLEKDLQGYRTVIEAQERYKSYRYTMTISLPWSEILLQRQDLRYEDLLNFPWRSFLSFTGNSISPQEEFRLLLEPYLPSGSALLTAGSPPLKPMYFNFNFTK